MHRDFAATAPAPPGCGAKRLCHHDPIAIAPGRRAIDPQLRSHYAACRRAQRRHDPTFFFATLRLPAEMRPAVHALYAFVRQADELVDGPARAPDPAARRRALDELERELFEAGPDTARPAVAALSDAAARHDLPLDELRTYMDSMRVDCGPVRISTRDDLDVYMDGSAAAVGRVMAPLLGAPPAATESFAQLGGGVPAHELHPRRARGLGARPPVPRPGRPRALGSVRGRAAAPRGHGGVPVARGGGGGAGARAVRRWRARRWRPWARACARGCGWRGRSTCACSTASSGWSTTCSRAARP